MFIGGFADALYALYMKKPVRSTLPLRLWEALLSGFEA
jgi:hypothetical protein